MKCVQTRNAHVTVVAGDTSYAGARGVGWYGGCFDASDRIAKHHGYRADDPDGTVALHRQWSCAPEWSHHNSGKHYIHTCSANYSVLGCMLPPRR